MSEGQPAHQPPADIIAEIYAGLAAIEQGAAAIIDAATGMREQAETLRLRLGDLATHIAPEQAADEKASHEDQRPADHVAEDLAESNAGETTQPAADAEQGREDAPETNAPLPAAAESPASADPSPTDNLQPAASQAVSTRPISDAASIAAQEADAHDARLRLIRACQLAIWEEHLPIRAQRAEIWDKLLPHLTASKFQYMGPGMHSWLFTTAQTTPDGTVNIKISVDANHTDRGASSAREILAAEHLLAHGKILWDDNTPLLGVPLRGFWFKKRLQDPSKKEDLITAIDSTRGSILHNHLYGANLHAEIKLLGSEGPARQIYASIPTAWHDPNQCDEAFLDIHAKDVLNDLGSDEPLTDERVTTYLRRQLAKGSGSPKVNQAYNNLAEIIAMLENGATAKPPEPTRQRSRLQRRLSRLPFAYRWLR